MDARLSLVMGAGVGGDGVGEGGISMGSGSSLELAECG